jgi:thymidylate kinase
MPQIEITRRPELMQDQSHLKDSLDAAVDPFFSTFFRALDRYGVRYCALHADGELLYHADFAVHPGDRRKLGGVVLELRELGYLAVQWLELESGKDRIMFGRVIHTRPETVTIDLTFRSRYATQSIKQLVQRRRRAGMFWLPAAEDTFDYLLSDAALHGVLTQPEAGQLKSLVMHLGHRSAEERAEQLFGRRWSEIVIAACVSSFDPELLARLGRCLRKRTVARKPLASLYSRIACWGRKLRSHFSRRGAFFVFLGPDGVGKTTLLREVSGGLAPLFPVASVNRWRPAVFARAPRPACLPHSKPLRGTRGSILYLLFAWIDFVAGYLLTTRWELAQSGLVIFDRYYHDMLVDPMRYRYNGPMWLVRALSKLVPPQDVFFFVLDADEQTILSRKQQLPFDEIRRQRALYRKFASQMPASVVVTTDRSIEGCRTEALQESFRYLSERLARRNPVWFGCGHSVVGPRFRLPLRTSEDSGPGVPVRSATESLDCERVLDTNQ